MGLLALLLPLFILNNEPIPKEAFDVFVKDLTETMTNLWRYQLIRPGSTSPRTLLQLVLNGEHPDIKSVNIKKILAKEEVQLLNAYTRNLEPKLVSFKGNLTVIGLNLNETMLELYDSKIVDQKGTLQFLKERSDAELGFLDRLIVSYLFKEES